MVVEMKHNSELLLLENLHPVLMDLQKEWKPNDPNRLQLLNTVVNKLTNYFESVDSAQLTFICTHNSRRSHLSQIWAQVASEYFSLNGVGVTTYSGGTEATACNPRTVNALRRAGFSVVQSTKNNNPIYLLQYADNRLPMKLFSKVYDQDGNPNTGYAAVMTCDHADQNCPIVRGCMTRVSFPFVDPKIADDTPEESQTYDDRLKEIGREIFYVFRNLEMKIKKTNK